MTPEFTSPNTNSPAPASTQVEAGPCEKLAEENAVSITDGEQPTSKKAKVKSPPTNKTSNDESAFLIDIDLINTEGAHLRLDADTSDLEASIPVVGLQQALVINPKRRLVSGGRRYTALKKLGYTKVPVRMLDFKDGECMEMASLVENLDRLEYSGVERDDKILRLKGLYESIYPRTKAGHAGALASNIAQGKEVASAESATVSFADYMAKMSDCSSRKIRQAVKRATEQTPDVREARDNKGLLDSQTDELIKLPPEKQDDVLPKVIGASLAETEALVAKALEKPVEPEDEKVQAEEIVPQGNPLLTDAAIKRLHDKIVKCDELVRKYKTLGGDLKGKKPNVIDPMVELSDILSQIVSNA
jgi:ParB-like chromosome segregation protein Spo0J